MHRLSCLLIAALIVGFTADLAPAQIGRGRLLKKMRDDIFGTPEERAREEAARRVAEQKRKTEKQQKAKLEAQRRAQAGRQPTPINKAQQPSDRSLQLQRYQQQQQRIQQQRAQANASKSRLKAPEEPVKNTAKRKKPEKKGFGFVAVEKGDKLIVTEVTRGGNADEAGIKRGDQIVGIGGVEVDSEDAFEEIAGILNPGDNIEIAYKRGKQTDDVQVSFGSVPETTQVDPEIAPALDLESTVDNRNDFVPPSRNKGVRGSSVLNQGDTSRQIDQLNETVEQQRKVIQQLQNQIRALQNTTAPGPNTQVPPIRSSNSILQTGPASNRSNR